MKERRTVPAGELSYNCNNPTPGACDFFGGTGGAHGSIEYFRSADGTQTWGDGQVTFGLHTVGGGEAGATHGTLDITSWTIAPGSAGPQTFFSTGTETDSYRGQSQTYPFTDLDSGLSAVPGHYTASDVFGFSAPGVSVNIQVAFRPAK
jgi:hypothetical protein